MIFLLIVSFPLPYYDNFSHQYICSFLIYARPSPLATTQVDAPNMDTHICPLNPVPHSPPLQIIYYQIHVVQFIFTLPFTKHHYSSQKSKQPPPPLHVEPPPTTSSLSNPPYILCLTPKSGHEPYFCPNYPPIQIISLVLFHSTINIDILLPLEVWVCLFHHLFFYHIS